MMDTSEREPPVRTRVRIGWALVWPLVVLGLLLRVLLYASYRDTGFQPFTLLTVLTLGLVLDVSTFAAAFAPVWIGLFFFSARIGLRRALLTAAAIAVVSAIAFVVVDRAVGRISAITTLAVPVLLGLGWLSARVLERTWPRRIALSVFFASIMFGMAVEYFFFDEFNSRFNHIALDYLLFPTEVATNIWESYPVVLYVGIALASGIGLAWITDRKLPRGSVARLAPKTAVTWGAAALVVAVAGVAVAGAVPALPWKNRITSEIAQNGWLGLVRAYRTSELDYDLYYVTLPTDEARKRAADVLGFPAPDVAALSAPADQFALERTIVSTRPAGSQPLDVVVVLEESLGSNFVGVLGAKGGLTPRLDEWSQRGMLCEHLVANGNRTVRGLEGVLCSFVPLPGDSITKRTPPAEAATLARVYAAQGYQTAFFYGGEGAFDGMEPFMSLNGWKEFVQQSDYPPGCFTTAWGVADENIFDALLERQKRAADEGKRFFGTVMSVSNHKPYLVPQGRTTIADGKRSREGAVAYSDWALGRWLDQAREAGLLEHTLVLVVGDHGARVYGRELIPVESYCIPALFVSPDARWRGVRLKRLCSQVDLGPTLVAMSGITCRAPFLGHDLSGLEDGPGRAFVQHNRDVGMLTDDVLVVLGLQKTVTFYRRSGRDGTELEEIAAKKVDGPLLELERDATAVFQTAYDIYRAGRYLPP